MEYTFSIVLIILFCSSKDGSGNKQLNITLEVMALNVDPVEF